MTINHYLVLDVRHGACPIPTIRTKEILDALTVSYVLKVITSKEHSIRNIRTLIKK
jgi:tRNA 2-thiouridine synthesizing protein A